ncbi:unnamed protein product [Callosobruchus maculatus]|uniref:BRICHOS domain-containing protein n=1 Tax=Callosobruchus maculatus TaxID=64391 RepID=A0A653D843_CALMS|nr:unnamed protein product [Callosobruchus maculatus]
MAPRTFFCASFVLLCVLNLPPITTPKEVIRKGSSPFETAIGTTGKYTALYDYENNVVVYKDLIGLKCILEVVQDGKSFIDKWIVEQKRGGIFQSLSVEEQQLSKRELWYLAKHRIIDFCKGLPTFYLEKQAYPNIPNDFISEAEENIAGRWKRQTSHYFKGRVRGQTQSQYLNFGKSDGDGKAEAESTVEGSKAVVSGTNGIGQAQSQSIPFGCDECYGHEETGELGRRGEKYPEPILQRPVGPPVPGQVGGPGVYLGPGQVGGVPGQFPGQTWVPGPGVGGGIPGQVGGIPGQAIPGQVGGTPGQTWTPGQTPGGGPQQAWQPGQTWPPGQIPGQERGQPPGQPGAPTGQWPTQSGPDQTQIGRAPGQTWIPGQPTGPAAPSFGPGQVPGPAGPSFGPGQIPGPAGPTFGPGQVGRAPGQTWVPGQFPDQVGVHPGQGWVPGQIPIQVEGPSQTQAGRAPGQTWITGQTPGQTWIPGHVPGQVGAPPGQLWAPGQIPSQIGGPDQTQIGRGPQQAWIPGQAPTHTGVPGQVSLPGQAPAGQSPGQDGPIPGQPWIPGQGPGQAWIPGGHAWTPGGQAGAPAQPLSPAPGEIRGPGQVGVPGWIPGQGSTWQGAGTQVISGQRESGTFGGNLEGNYQSNLGHGGRFSGQFSGQYESYGGTGGRIQVTGAQFPGGQIPGGPSGRPAQPGVTGITPGWPGGPAGAPSWPGAAPRGPGWQPGAQAPGQGLPGIPGAKPEGPGVSGWAVGPPTGPGIPGFPSGVYGGTPVGYPGAPSTGGYVPGSTPQFPGTGTGVRGPITAVPGGYPGIVGGVPGTVSGRLPGGYPGVEGGVPGAAPGGFPGGYPGVAGQVPGGYQGQIPGGYTGPSGYPSITGGPTGTFPSGVPGGYPGGVPSGAEWTSGSQEPWQAGPSAPSGPPQTWAGTPGGPQGPQPGWTGPSQGPQAPGVHGAWPGGQIPGVSGIPGAPTGISGVPGAPSGVSGIPGPPPGVPQQYVAPGVVGGVQYGAGQAGDDSDSQVQTSVLQLENGTQAQAQAQGIYAGGTAQSQVSGTYSGSGSFSASAGSDDGKRGAMTQVAGGKDGAQSSAQGRGGLGTSQSQVVLSSETGNTLSSAQSSGLAHGTQSQVEASEKGGLADAQANGAGNTSSQAQIGFTPYQEEDDDNQTTTFRGGGTAGAQSGALSGMTQTQVQGKFRYGIRYTGGAQAASGVPFGKNSSDGPFKPLDLRFDSPVSSRNKGFTQAQTGKVSLTAKRSGETTTSSTTSHPITTVEAVTLPPKSKDTQHNSAEYDEDDDYEDYEEETSRPATRNIISQVDTQQKQHIVLDPLKDMDVTVVQSRGSFPPDGTVIGPGESIPGSPGYRIPLGFRGTVKSMANGKNTYAIGRHSQAQSVALSPGTGKIIYTRPIYAVTSNTQSRNGEYGYGSGYTFQPAYQPVKYQFKNGKTLPDFVSVTKSETGSKNLVTGKKTPSVSYTQSSTCGIFINHCVYNAGKKLCFPKAKTNPDGTIMGC